MTGRDDLTARGAGAGEAAADALEAEVARLRGALFDLAWKVRLEADGRRAALAVLADSEEAPSDE